MQEIKKILCQSLGYGRTWKIRWKGENSDLSTTCWVLAAAELLEACVELTPFKVDVYQNSRNRLHIKKRHFSVETETETYKREHKNT